MRDYTNEHLKNTRKNKPNQFIRDAYIADDGFRVSIQASDGHYCTPRRNNSNYYENVELGYPNEEIKDWKDYAENPDRLTDTIYGYIPVEIVNKELNKHNLSNKPYQLYIGLFVMSLVLAYILIGWRQ